MASKDIEAYGEHEHTHGQHDHTHGEHEHSQEALEHGGHEHRAGKQDKHGRGPGGHTHGVVDPSIAATKEGIKAVAWSFVGLAITFVIQLVIVLYTNSTGLLADTIHNLGDALTAVPLFIAFRLSMRKPTKRFNYGLGRVEDVAGILIVLIILFSAVVAGYESIKKIIYPEPVNQPWIVAIASLIGFAGNEIVAIFRIRTGKRIGSAALIADGYHARTDGFTSLAVLIGAGGVLLGFPLADPIVGLLISVTIFKIVWDSVKSVFIRAMDGVDKNLTGQIEHSVRHVKGIGEIQSLRARWVGHRLYMDLSLRVDGRITVTEASALRDAVEHELDHHIPFLGDAVIEIGALGHALSHDNEKDEHGHPHGHNDAHDHKH